MNSRPKTTPPSALGLRRSAIAALATILLTLGTGAQEIDETVKLALQRNYSNWKRSMISKDLAGWNAHTSRHRQTITRNLIVSQKLDWPRSLFAVSIQPPETRLLRLIEAGADKNIGRLAYYGPVDFRVSDEVPPNNILMLYFRKEKGEWKFDRTRHFNLIGNERVKGMAKNGNFSFLTDPEFRLSGEALPTPPLCPSPLYVGKIRIVSVGYRTTAKFNAFHHTIVDDTIVNEILIGGLRKGPNKLKLKVAGTGGIDPKKKILERKFEISVFVTSKNKKRPAIRVFYLNPGEKVESEYDLTVWANAVTMRK